MQYVELSKSLYSGITLTFRLPMNSSDYIPKIRSTLLCFIAFDNMKIPEKSSSNFEPVSQIPRDPCERELFDVFRHRFDF